MFKATAIKANKWLASFPNKNVLIMVVFIIPLIAYHLWQTALYKKQNADFTQQLIEKDIQIDDLLAKLLMVDTNSGSNVVIDWTDNTESEDGFVIEKKRDGEEDYAVVAILDANSTSFIDTSKDGVEDTYCYRVGALQNNMPTYSETYCVLKPSTTNTASGTETDTGTDAGTETDTQSDTTTDMEIETGGYDDIVIPPGSALSIDYDISSSQESIELSGREFYCAKSDLSLNTDFSVNEISNASIRLGEGNLSYKETIYVFNDDDLQVANGYVSMKYNEQNGFGFILEGDGIEQQVATLYISAGAWSSDDAELEIKAGDLAEIITLPSSHSMHYIAVDITFDESTFVEFTPLGEHGSYSAVGVAAIVLNEANTESIVDDSTSPDMDDASDLPSYAEVYEVDFDSTTTIDVSETAYMTSEGSVANDDYSNGVLESVTYTGSSTFKDSSYEFIEDDNVVDTGYTKMTWDEGNSVIIAMSSASDSASLTSLYFRAGAWTEELIEFELIVNGESTLIELTTSRSWSYLRIDIEFEGALTVEARPLSHYESYSAFYFAGATLSE